MCVPESIFIIFSEPTGLFIVTMKFKACNVMQEHGKFQREHIYAFFLLLTGNRISFYRGESKRKAQTYFLELFCPTSIYYKRGWSN